MFFSDVVGSVGCELGSSRSPSLQFISGLGNAKGLSKHFTISWNPVAGSFQIIEDASQLLCNGRKLSMFAG